MPPLQPGDINLADQADMARIGTAPWDYLEVLRRETLVVRTCPVAH